MDKKHLPTIALIWILLTGTAAASEPPAHRAEGDPRMELIQVTASRRAESVSRAIQAVTVIDEEEILAAAPQVPADVFRGRAGVFVQQTTPGQGVPIVRGLKGSEVLHLVDGMRLNNALFRNAPNQYLGLVEAAALERVEVVRGPASTLHGADAMGGVVQLFTRRPELIDEARRQWSTQASVSSADAAVGAWAAVESGRPERAWRLQLGYRDVGDRRTPDGRLRPSGYRARSLVGSWRALAGERGEWQLDIQHLRQPSTPRVDELIPGFGQSEAASSEFFFEPNERDFVHLRYAGDHTTGLFNALEVHAAYQRIVDDRRTRGLDDAEQILEANSSELWGLTAQLQRPAGGGMDLLYGLELYHDRVASRRAAVFLATGLAEPRTARFPDGSTQSSAALYAHLRHQPLPGVSLSGGLRYSLFDIDLAMADRPAGARLDLDELTFSAGLRWDLNDRWHLVMNVGEGFRAPNIFDLGTLGSRPGNRFNVANPGLSAERLIGLDMGLKWQTPSWEGEWVVFVSDYQDKITSVPTGEFTPAGRQVVQSRNVNELRLHGSEFALRYFGGERWELFAAVNQLRATETGADGARTAGDRIPPFNGRVGTRWRYSEALELSLLGHFARRQERLSPRDLGDPRINPAGTPGWMTWSVRFDWRASPRWRLSGGLENIFDRGYREHGSGLDGRGRGLVLTWSAEF